MASLTQLVLSLPRDSSETFLLGKLVGHRAQSPVGFPYPLLVTSRVKLTHGVRFPGVRSMISFAVAIHLHNTL